MLPWFYRFYWLDGLHSLKGIKRLMDLKGRGVKEKRALQVRNAEFGMMPVILISCLVDRKNN
jgi:hypothetical protein